MKKKNELIYECTKCANGDVVCKCAKYKCKNPSECKAHLLDDNSLLKDLNIPFNDAMKFFDSLISF